MSKCENCKNEVELPENTLINVESYQKSVLSVTNCCGCLVRVYPKMGFILDLYVGLRTEDDWGRKCKKA